MECKTVLLVDDDDNTLALTRFVLKHLVERPRLAFVPNGEAAMHYLEGRGRFADRESYPMPDLILLDLKMPVMNGFEFLDWLRANPKFNCLPVVVLTGSVNHRDQTRARGLGANGFIEKTGELLEYETSLKNAFGSFLQAPAPAGRAAPYIPPA